MLKIFIGFTMMVGVAFGDAPVVQTGQTTIYEVGDDGTYQAGIARSYSRDDINGIVTDNATGIEWQDNEVGSQMDQLAAIAHCDSLPLDGRGWRLPTIEELMSITDKSRHNPVVNQDAPNGFQNITADDYWSSTTLISGTSYAWLIGFDDGDDGIGVKSNESHYVRCVRGQQAASSSYIRDAVAETVVDKRTGLTWQDNINVQNNDMNWSKAIKYCEDLELPSGVDDWRLPNFNELYMIADRSRFNPAMYMDSVDGIDNNGFKYVKINNYWSSTTPPTIAESALLVGFQRGYVSTNNKIGSKYVRCVRGEHIDLSGASLVPIRMYLLD